MKDSTKNLLEKTVRDVQQIIKIDSPEIGGLKIDTVVDNLQEAQNEMAIEVAEACGSRLTILPNI